MSAAQQQAPQSSLETIVREYRGTREYERDVRSRRREGWRVVSVLQRPGAPTTLRRLAVTSGLAKPNTEYLVTFSRVPQPYHRPRPLEWLTHPHLPRLPRARPARYVWLVIALLLLALLAYGLLDFFADALRG